ncbi:MAG: Amidase [Methanonatronarchaeales archaeon]|nr:Amidase [Methanonatronarchaeales archaeon]
MSAREQAESVRWGAEDPSGLLEAALEGARADDFNCFVTVDTDASPGDDDGLLAGQPVAVKDSITTEGLETTVGSKILKGYEPVFDAYVVERLREEGATVVGKTNCDEFCMGSTTETSAFGPTRNPLDPSLVPGGSSGGSGAAVAAGHVDLALGSDTGGSVRNPAAFTSTVGLKPTYGLLSRYGLIPYADSLETVGPMTRTVEDCALLLSAIGGRDPRDSTSRGERKRYEPTGLDEPVRVGVIEELVEGSDDGVKREVRDAVSSLDDAGHDAETVEMEGLDHVVSAYYVLAMSEASSNLARYDGVRYGAGPNERGRYDEVFAKVRGDNFGDEVKRRIMLGTYALSEGYSDRYYRKALLARRLIADEFDRLFSKVDLLLSPTMPVEPFRLGEALEDPLRMYLSDVCTVPANLAGIPAISVPAEEGEAVGVQLMGPEFSEELLLDAAREVELVR